MLKNKYTRLYQAVVGAILLSAFWAATPACADIAADKSSAVIFVYQHVGEDTVGQGNISVEQFQEHINELKKGGYTVLPVPQIIDTLKKNAALPPKTVGITFEGAYQATLNNAFPLLKEANLPFTLFFATDMAEGGTAGHMVWDQIKKLQKTKTVSFGILPANYEHMVNQTAEQNATLINRAVSRYRDLLGEEPAFFAYPYGEYNETLKKQLATYNFKAIFGQHSGVATPLSDFAAIPRFTMTDDYGDIDRFLLTANALSLPVTDVVPEDTIMAKNPPIIGFTVSSDITNLGKLACFGSGLGKLPLTRIGASRIEIRPGQPFPDRRTRINCTLPNNMGAPGEGISWRWFGILLIAPNVDEDAGDTSNAPQNMASPENQ